MFRCDETSGNIRIQLPYVNIFTLLSGKLAETVCKFL